MQFLKSLVSLAMLAAVVYVGVTVPLGEKTLLGHVRAIWGAKETQQLVDGVRETSGPMLERLDRAVTAGVEEARRHPAERADEAEDPDVADSAQDADGARDNGEPGRDRDGAGAPAGDRGGPAGSGHPGPASDAVARGDAPEDDRRAADFELRPKIDIHVSP